MNNTEDIQIIRKIDNIYAVNSYCLVCNGHAIVIDPVMPDMKQIMSQYEIDFVILTHEHYDHICGVNACREKYNTNVYCGEKAKHGLSEPSINMSKYVEYLATVIPFGNHEIDAKEYKCVADETLTDNQMIEWQGHTLFIKETPGHSKGSISILFDKKYLFSGDIVFKDYPTATRLPGGSTKAFRTVTEPWLESLPENVIVYPGHAEPFKLNERYSINH